MNNCLHDHALLGAQIGTYLTPRVLGPEGFSRVLRKMEQRSTALGCAQQSRRCSNSLMCCEALAKAIEVQSAVEGALDWLRQPVDAEDNGKHAAALARWASDAAGNTAAIATGNGAGAWQEEYEQQLKDIAEELGLGFATTCEVPHD